MVGLFPEFLSGCADDRKEGEDGNDLDITTYK
jgi:hypothetical protein